MLVQRIRPGQGQHLRALRVLSLQTDDVAFGMSTEQLQRLTHDDWEQACAHQSTGDNAIFVAHHADIFVGMVGIRIDVSPKMRHAGMLWGMYVHPAYRGHGLGGQLLEHAIAHGRAHTLHRLTLSVSAPQHAAIALYQRHGFATYAREPAYLSVDGQYIDALHMHYMYTPSLIESSHHP